MGFEPHAGDNWSRDEDHLALIIELLGEIPTGLLKAGTQTHSMFTSQGKLRNISKLKFWPLINVLTEKYDWAIEDAAPFADLLTNMMTLNPHHRYSAEQCLSHPWLNDEVEFDLERYMQENKIVDNIICDENSCSESSEWVSEDDIGSETYDSDDQRQEQSSEIHIYNDNEEVNNGEILINARNISLNDDDKELISSDEEIPIARRTRSSEI